jgi:hypothetical protein
VPQLFGANKDESGFRPIQLQIMPETLQTIIKCIGSSSTNISNELTQEILQINTQARLLLEKQQQLQQQQQQQIKGTQNPLATVGNQGTIEMIQSMINNLNQQSVNFSPNRFNIFSQLNSAAAAGGTNANSSNNNVAGLVNLVSGSGNSADANKMNILNLFGNAVSLNKQQPTAQQQQFNNPIRSSLHSPLANAGDMASTGLNSAGEQQGHGLYPKEIEDEVDKCIHSLFKTNTGNTPSLSVDDFVSILNKLKDSQEKKDKVCYRCYLLISLLLLFY